MAKAKKEPQPLRWNLASIWNEAALKEDRPPRKRDYVYASEIGGAMYDRILKMNGTPYTNPPNNRSLRKFLAGNIWEHITKQVLIATGLYKHEEVKIDNQPYPDTLHVHGRCDFIAGGFIDMNEAIQNIEKLHLPDSMITIAHRIVYELAGKTLKKYILELKAVSTFAMDRVERLNAAIPNHQLQGYHYHRSGIDAAVAYICKDDCRMAQYEINPDIVEPLYRADLLKITDYLNSGEIPPLEPLVTFDQTAGTFKKNFQVEWSPYLSHYGFSNPDEYREAVKYADRWNRGIARYALCEIGTKTPTGKPMTLTAMNREVRTEIEAAGYNFDELLRCIINLGVPEEVQE